MEPPALLDSARVLMYAETGGSNTYTGRRTIFVDGELLDPVPCLAICEELVEGRTLLLHCDSSWNVLAASFDASIEAALAAAERAYAGISSNWKRFRQLTKHEEREVEEMRQSLQELAAQFQLEKRTPGAA